MTSGAMVMVMVSMSIQYLSTLYQLLKTIFECIVDHPIYLSNDFS